MFSANLAPIYHCLKTQWNEIVADPHHLGVLSVVLKSIPSLWYVQHKLCTYLALRLALSPNGLNRASTWALSPRSTMGASKKRFLSLWYVGHKPRTYLAIIQTLPPNGMKRDSTWPKSPRSSIRCIEKQHPSLWYILRKPCPYLALGLAISPNRPNRASTWAPSPRSSIGCVQNDFWAYGTFSANRAPILCQD
jgi:hypothetical protein